MNLRGSIGKNGNNPVWSQYKAFYAYFYSVSDWTESGYNNGFCLNICIICHVLTYSVYVIQSNYGIEERIKPHYE